MSSVEEIKAAIEQLKPADQASLLRWINDHADDDWDRQIKADVAAGKLKPLLDQVRADIRSGNVRKMP